MNELIVVAAHGPDFAGQCVASLPPDASRLVVDTGSGTVPNPDVVLPGGHPTAAYRWAYENTDADRFLFIQDSMTAIVDDPVKWFRDQLPEPGAVAWGLFGMAFDTYDQQQWVQNQYPGPIPALGIMGPIFYTSRATLDLLDEAGLLPAIPADRMQAQGTERAWAFAFDRAGVPVVGPMWNHGAMQVGFGPFRKVWAGRP
jgi:hypothetical protein